EQPQGRGGGLLLPDALEDHDARTASGIAAGVAERLRGGDPQAAGYQLRADQPAGRRRRVGRPAGPGADHSERGAHQPQGDQRRGADGQDRPRGASTGPEGAREDSGRAIRGSAEPLAEREGVGPDQDADRQGSEGRQGADEPLAGPVLGAAQQQRVYPESLNG